MKQKGWKRRVLPVLLAVAMVLGSVDAASFVTQAAVNAYEATSGTHGATYDSENNQVTFYVKDTDTYYSQTDSMWCKEYNTYEEAAAAHVSAGGNFIAGLAAVNLTEGDNSDGGKSKTYTVEVTSGTGAILYYFNAGAGHDRTQYEHIIVIGDSAGGDDNTGDENQGGEGYVIVAPGADLTGITTSGEATNGWSAWTDKGVQAAGGSDTVTFTYPAEKLATDWAL